MGERARDGLHFERMAGLYATARPPYPAGLYALLREEGVAAPGRRVLEVGAGSGLATGDLLALGAEVVAVEPGPDLGALLAAAHPTARVQTARLEDAVLEAASFDAAVAATSLHWVDLDTALPLLHRVVRPGGRLAVWRTVFGDDAVRTPFRDAVHEVVARRGGRLEPLPREHRPTVAELTQGGLFGHERSEEWRWSVDLDPERVRALFATFSDWSPAEVDAVQAAAVAVGGPDGTVTEHYRTVLHLLRREDSAPARPAP